MPQQGNGMRSNSLGWAVIVLAVTLTIWNVMEYERQMSMSRLPEFSEPEWDSMMEARRSHVLPRYVEREVLIVGGAVAAWLIVVRRKAP